MQSGKDKGNFVSKLADDNVHLAEITGLGVDALNKIMVSSSLDSTLKLWDFFRRELIKTYSCQYPVENLVYNRLNDLIAFSQADMSVQVVNVRAGLKKVREFPQVASNKVTDICFSQPDSKWVICASLDKSIRVYDILTGTLVDWVQFKRAPISLDFSPSGEFLATSHVGSKAVYLWSNRGHFQNLIIQRVPTKPTLIDLPSLSEQETVKHSHKDFYSSSNKDDGEAVEITLIGKKLEELDEVHSRAAKERQDFVRLSNQPYSKWQAIFNLEQIKERNKPSLPKKELPKAPFFLFDIDKVVLENDAIPDLLKEQFFSKDRPETKPQKDFSQVVNLKTLLRKGNWIGVNDYLKTLSPSGVELEFLSLSTFDLDSKDEESLLSLMLDFFLAQVSQRVDTDFTQAMLNCFLKAHYEVLL